MRTTTRMRMVNGRMSRASRNGGQIQSTVSSLGHHDRLAQRSLHLRPGTLSRTKITTTKTTTIQLFSIKSSVLKKYSFDSLLMAILVTHNKSTHLVQSILVLYTPASNSNQSSTSYHFMRINPKVRVSRACGSDHKTTPQHTQLHGLSSSGSRPNEI